MSWRVCDSPASMRNGVNARATAASSERPVRYRRSSLATPGRRSRAVRRCHRLIRWNKRARARAIPSVGASGDSNASSPRAHASSGRRTQCPGPSRAMTRREGGRASRFPRELSGRRHVCRDDRQPHGECKDHRARGPGLLGGALPCRRRGRVPRSAPRETNPRGSGCAVLCGRGVYRATDARGLAFPHEEPCVRKRNGTEGGQKGDNLFVCANSPKQ